MRFLESVLGGIAGFVFGFLVIFEKPWVVRTFVTGFIPSPNVLPQYLPVWQAVMGFLYCLVIAALVSVAVLYWPESNPWQRRPVSHYAAITVSAPLNPWGWSAVGLFLTGFNILTANLILNGGMKALGEFLAGRLNAGEIILTKFPAALGEPLILTGGLLIALGCLCLHQWAFWRPTR